MTAVGSIPHHERRILLFMDLDGVLRPVHGSGMPHIGRIERLLGAYKTLDIVITDPIRASMSLEAIKALFPAAVASRIIGVTEVFDFKGQDDAGAQEAIHFAHNFEDGYCSYVIVSADRHRYMQRITRKHNVAFTDPAIGLDRSAEIRVRSLLTQATHYDPTASVRAFAHCAITDRSLFNDGYPSRKAWEPAVVMFLPRTEQVQAVVGNTLAMNTLARRLWRGLDRIYLHEMALIRRPQLRPTLYELHRQFPARLRVVPMDPFDCSLFKTYANEHGIEDAEQLLMGHALVNAYRDDIKERGMREPDLVLQLGQPPRRHITFGWPIEVAAWERLDDAGVQALVRDRDSYVAQRDAETQEVLAASLMPAAEAS